MDNPSIVPIYDLGKHEGSLFFVMPVVQGTNLRGFIRDQALTLGEVIDVGIQVAEALDYSHTRDVIHRDIKPENIMVSREEGSRVRVRIGFRFQGCTESRITKTGTIAGTLAYLSPEQVISSGSVDNRSDIYSLGTVLYECLTGEPPFSGELQSILYRIVHEIPQPPRSMGAAISEELEEVVLSCIAKEPAKRPHRAGEVAEALRRAQSRLHDSDLNKSVLLTRTMMLPRPALSPFIGREKELAELQKRLNAAVSGECQFVVVGGDPGAGKTRLLDGLKTLQKRASSCFTGALSSRRRLPTRDSAKLSRILPPKDTGASAQGQLMFQISRLTWCRCSRCLPRSATFAPRLRANRNSPGSASLRVTRTARIFSSCLRVP
jgi:serine/threonine protein kinase